MASVIEKLGNNKLLKFASEHTALVIAIGSVFAAMSSLAIQMFDYIRLKCYALYFNVPIQYVSLDSKGYLYEFLISFSKSISLMIGGYIIYELCKIYWCNHLALKEVFENYNVEKSEKSGMTKRECHNRLKDMHIYLDFNYSERKIYFSTLIALNAYLLIVSANIYLDTHSQVIILIALLIIGYLLNEMFFASMFFYYKSRMEQFENPDDNVNTPNNELFEKVTADIYKKKLASNSNNKKCYMLKVISIIIISLMLCYAFLSGCTGFSQAKSKKSFEIVDGNKYAIIQRFDGKCLLINIEIVDDNLTINSYKQKVVSEDDLVYEYILFDKVIVNRSINKAE